MNKKKSLNFLLLILPICLQSVVAEAREHKRIHKYVHTQHPAHPPIAL